jgi:hypothetical protein
MSIETNITGRIKPSDFYTLLQLVVKKLDETNENMHSLQKATAAMREQFSDLGAEHEEDNAELKRLLWELRWISKERM